MFLVFCMEKVLYLSNKWFKREEKRKVTFRMEENETEVDFIFTKKNIDSFLQRSDGNPWEVSTCVSGSR